jgi:anti-sigma B factor antagonist
MEFNYKIKESDDTKPSIIRMEGNLIEKSQAIELLDDLENVLEKGKNHFIVDMSGFRYMNSTGLNVLVNILTKARNAGGETVICCIPEKIKDLLVVTKLNNVFTIAENMNDAQRMMEEATSK